MTFLSSSVFAISLLSLTCGALSAGPVASTWHTLEIENLGCQISVPLKPPGDESSVRMTGEDRNFSAGSGEGYTRLQNYSEAELLQGEVPQMRPGQFFLEIKAVAEEQPEGHQTTSACDGPVNRFPAPAIGEWCSFDPALLQGEASITHIAWLWQGGVQYRLQLDGSRLEEGEPSRLLTSFTCNVFALRRKPTGTSE